MWEASLTVDGVDEAGFTGEDKRETLYGIMFYVDKYFEDTEKFLTLTIKKQPERDETE